MNKPPPWLTPSLFLLWQTQFIVRAAAMGTAVGLSYHLATRTGDATLLATLASSAVLPGLVVQLAAGVLADRHSPRRVMAGSVLADATLAGVVLAGLGATAGELPWGGWGFVPFILLSSLARAFYDPSEDRLVADLTPREHYSRVFSIDQISAQVAAVTGGALGPWVAERGGLTALFGLQLGGNVVALSLLLFVRDPKPVDVRRKADGAPPDVAHSWRADLLEAWEFLRGNGGLLRLQFGLGLAFGATYFLSMVAIPLLLTGPMGMEPSAGGGVMIASALGGFLGVMLANTRARRDHARREISWFCGGLFLLGAGTVFMGGLRSYPCLLALLALGGVVIGYVLVRGRVLLLEAAPEAMRGRVVSWASLLLDVWPAVCTLAGGVLTASIGSHLAASFAACGLLVAGAAVWLAASPAVQGTLDPASVRTLAGNPDSAPEPHDSVQSNSLD